MRAVRYLLVLALLVSCGAVTEDPATGDAGARLACRDFYGIAAEADLVTDAELRSRVRDMYDSHASVSETPGIAESAREMLATITSADVDAFGRAIEDMDAACQPVEPL